MADGQDRWKVRGVVPELQRQVAVARGVTVGSLVTDALTARLDALERGARPAIVEALPVPAAPPVQPCRRRAIWTAARGG
jgi:hypothetical protein